MVKNKKNSAAPKRFLIQLSWAEAAGWTGVILLICGWFFVLGITVGRGLIPAVNSQNDLQQELLAAREKMLAEQAQANVSSPALDFHEALTDDSGLDMAPGVNTTTTPSSATKLPVKTAEKYKKVGADPSSAPAKQSASEPPSALATEKIFTVQVAALRDRATAMELSTELEKAGFSVYTVKVTLSADNVWYRVRSGAFASREEAEPLLGKLKQAGYEPILAKRQKKT